MSTTKQVVALLVFLGICFAVAGLGSTVTMPATEGWYRTLEKPSWIPPSWVFGPVWSLLYLMMAVAAWLVWRKAGTTPPLPLALFFVQLALNLEWSFLFFGAKRPDLAFIDIVLLWLAIAATIWAFSRVSTVAAWLMVPYILWVSFASALNFTIWQMNR